MALPPTPYQRLKRNRLLTSSLIAAAWLTDSMSHAQLIPISELPAAITPVNSAEKQPTQNNNLPSALTPAPGNSLPTSPVTPQKIGSKNTNLPPAITPIANADQPTTNPLEKIAETDLNDQNLPDGLEKLTKTPTEPHFTYNFQPRLTFDDNLFLRDQDKTEDVILSLKARAAWESGKRGRSIHWLSFYAEPTLVKYADNSELDNIDYKLGALYEFREGDTILRSQINYSDTNETDRFISERINREQLIFSVDGRRRLSGKTALDSSLELSYSSNERFSDVTRFSGRLSALYQFSDKIQIGPFLGTKRAEVGNSPDQYAFSAGTHFRYELTNKIDLESFLGLEYLGFSSSQGSSFDPTFSLTAKYQQSEKINHQLNLAYRSNPAFNINSTGYQAASLDYRIRYQPSPKVVITGGFGYENDQYFRTGGNQSNLPDIDYFTANLGITYRWSRQLSGAVRYNHRTSDSTVANGDFTNNRLGFSLDYKF